MKFTLILLLLISFLIGCKEDEPALMVKACFDFQKTEMNGDQYQFTNCSENASHFLWKFSDGKTSTEKEPKHLFETNFSLIASLIVYNGNESDTLTRNLRGDIMVYKPNIYIYPLKHTDLCVTLSFPMGGQVVESIPDYSTGWCVNVKPNGRINDQYNYLFYESTQPNIFQYNKGWCVAQRNLQSFFESNMKEYNFSDSEIKDFTDHWLPLLTESEYFCIYPQTNQIVDQIISLNFSVQPEKLYRLFYGIVETDEYKEMESPAIQSFERNGYYVVEWGVFRN